MTSKLSKEELPKTDSKELIMSLFDPAGKEIEIENQFDVRRSIDEETSNQL